MPIPQNSLQAQAKRDLRWGSHIPLNISILKTFPITGVLELGAGMNSTPEFFKNCNNVISIESDKNWIDKLRTEQIIIETDTQKLIHHYIPPNINRSTIRADIPTNILLESIQFYNQYINPTFNYLFVDHFAGFRLEALNKLYNRFDIIAYHDAERKDDYWYSYTQFKPNDNYIHFIDETFIANTGLVISKKFESLIPEFIKNLEIESQKYAHKFDAQYKTTLTRQK